MGIRQKLSDAIRGRSKKEVVIQERSNSYCVNPLASSYENMFAQVRPLINEMKTIFPYAVGANGGKIPLSRAPELALLNAPNYYMGWQDFADAMFATWLTEDELNIHVHFSGRKVVGYTILPVGSRNQYLNGDGIQTFQVTDADGLTETITEYEVMTLRFSRSPRNLDKGVSPTSSVEIWAQIDDLVSQYQRAFFSNGAKPSTITIIKASSHEKFLEKQKELERQTKGAKNSNKTLYLWRGVLDNGATMDEVEVKTIQGNNSTLALKEIADIISDRLNKSVGVSNFLLGDDSSAKYDNAELSDHVFTKRRVYPALMMFWSEFQHELNRVLMAQTGKGLSYGINFELEIPELTDRLKTQAETKQINASIEREDKRAAADIARQDKIAEADVATKNMTALITLIEKGASSESAIRALNLSSEWKQVADELEINSGVAIGGSIVPQNESGVKELPTGLSDHNDLGCQHTADAAPNELDPEFSPDEIIERAIYEELLDLYEDLVNDELGEKLGLTEEQINALIDRVLEKLMEVAPKAVEETVEQVEKTTNSLPVAVIVGLINGQKPKSREELIAAIKKETTTEKREEVEDTLREAFQKRIEEIVKNYAKEAEDVIRKTLNSTEGKTKGQIKNELLKGAAGYIPKYRAEMIARNEVINAFREASLAEAKHLSKTYGLKMRKTWHAQPGECPICAALDGTSVELNDSFPTETVEQDGRQYSFEHSIYNVRGETCNAHVNCRCYVTYEVIG